MMRYVVRFSGDGRARIHRANCLRVPETSSEEWRWYESLLAAFTAARFFGGRAACRCLACLG